MSPSRGAVTQLLHDWRAGNREALDELMPLVYQQLRSLAEQRMRSENPGHTLRATALVHEAYMRLVGADISFTDRSHFFAISARLMRRILIDHAKNSRREKRGGGAVQISLDESVLLTPESPGILLDIDEALERLTLLDARKSEIVELVFFGGLQHDEVAEALNISPTTVRRELRLAKAWLYNELRSQEA